GRYALGVSHARSIEARQLRQPASRLRHGLASPLRRLRRQLTIEPILLRTRKVPTARRLTGPSSHPLRREIVEELTHRATLPANDDVARGEHQNRGRGDGCSKD